MWMLILMTLFNSVLHQQKVQNEYRLTMGIIQVGAFEIVLALGFLYAMVMGGSIRGRFPPLRSHPVVIWVVGLMFIGGFFGILGALINGNMPKFVLSSAREWFAWPVCFLIGYRLLGTPKNVRTLVTLMIVAGVFTATALFWSFGATSEKASLTGSLNPVRSIIIAWHSEYAAIAGLLMVYVVMMRVRMWPMWLSLIVGLYCYIGYGATLSRLGYLILIFGTLSTFALLPEGERSRKFVRAMVFLPVLFFASWGALWVGDQIIGRNFSGKVLDHMATLLPFEREGSQDVRAWDSRIDGIVAELSLWIQNPLMGEGFGAGETAFNVTSTFTGTSLKHNGWTATLLETGVFGAAGLAVMIGSLLLVGFRMVHDRTNLVYSLVGALGFITGVVVLLRVTGTLSVISRAALGFAVVAGALIRAREIQETEIALAQQQADWDVYDPYVDQDTGLLVPDYGWEMSHFGTTSN